MQLDDSKIDQLLSSISFSNSLETLNELKGRLAPKNQKLHFFVSNDIMKGPESRKFFFFILKISVTVKIHTLCTSGSDRKFQMGPWGAVYVTSQGDSTLNILRESYCFCPLD